MGIRLTSQSQPSYIQVLIVSLPARTPWSSDSALQLMTSIFDMRVPLTLGILARPNSIFWFIEVPKKQVNALKSSIFAAYPRAEIFVQNKTKANIGYYQYCYEAAAPYVGPLKTIDGFNNYDPLNHLLVAMNNLKEEEEIIYSLSLKPARNEIYEIGDELRKENLTRWWHYLTPQGTALTFTRKAMGVDEVERFSPDFQKIVDMKMNSTLMETMLSFKYKTKTIGRAKELRIILEPALAQFELEGSNFLARPQSHSFALTLFAKEVASLWHLPNEQCQVQGINWASEAKPLPTELHGKKEHLLLGKNTYQNKENEVWLNNEDRRSHVNILGKTNMGKSTLMQRMIHQDIAEGKAVGVIDPHGDLYKDILSNCIPKERTQDVVLFDMQDKNYPVSLNMLAPVDGVAKKDLTGQVLSIIRKMFADQWSATRMEDSFYAAIMSLLAVPDATIASIPRMFMNSDYRSEVLKQVSDPVALEYWLDEFGTLSKNLKFDYARPISSRIRRFYRDETIRNVVCQPDSLNFRQIIDKKTIFLANLGGLPEIETEILGALLISKFQTAAMSRGQLELDERNPFYLYIDEVQRFITTSLDTVFSEARKYGLSMTVANQYLRQLEGDTFEAIMGNVGTTIMFSLGSKDTTTMAPYVKPQFDSEDLLNLDQFETIVKMRLKGKALQAFNMNTLPALSLPEEKRAAASQLIEQSRTKYARPKEEVEKEFTNRFQKRLDALDSENDDDKYAG